MCKVSKAQNRIKRQLIDAAKASVRRWESVAEKHKPGSFVYNKAMANANAARLELEQRKANK